jgi:Fuc2NAc and GlcNAc transferase
VNVVADQLTFGTWSAIVLLAAGLSFLGSTAAMRLARRGGVLAQPGERQSHRVATPTGGGLGLVFSLAMTSFLIERLLRLPDFWWRDVLPGVIVLAAVGWIDDRRHVATPLRLAVQLAVSLWLLHSVCIWGPTAGPGLCSLMVLAVVWLMNLYNFMDGSNGMAGFQGVFAGLVMAGLFAHAGQTSMAAPALIVAAVCAGFLPLNFPLARVFMGDAGSVPLGFVIAALAVYGLHSGAFGPALPLLVMAVFVVDASLTLAARVIRGEQWYTAHNQHVYQRLIVQGWSHSRVLIAYQTINVGLVLPAVVLAVTYPQHAAEITGLVIIALVGCWYLINRRLGMPAKEQLQ